MLDIEKNIVVYDKEILNDFCETENRIKLMY